MHQPPQNDLIALLETCRALNIRFSVHGHDLKVKFTDKEIPSQVIEQIKENKQNLISFIINQRRSDDIIDSPIDKSSDQHQGPLSTLQRAMWYASKFSNDKELLCYYASTRIQGNLNITALAAATSACLIKHPALRMLINEDSEGIVTQRLTDGYVNQFTYVDCRYQDREAQDKLEKDAIDTFKSGFDLARDVKFKSLLLQLTDDQFDFLIAVHHCVTDGWSIDLLMRDISRFYNSLAANAFSEKDQNPEIPSWLDYIQWLHLQYETASWQDAKDYWRKRMAGSPKVHNLPLDKPRPPVQSFCTRRFIKHYPTSLLSQIKRIANAEGTSIYVVILAAISLLISKLSGEEDIVIGTSVANRPREEFSRIIGLFTNVVCMRSQCLTSLTFDEYLQKVHQNFLRDMEYQFLPFEEVLSLQSSSERSPSYSPLAQILFILQNNEFNGIRLEGLQCTTSHLDSGKSQYDIAISGVESENGLLLYWDYAKDLFSEATINVYSSYLENLLTAVTEFPHRKLYEYSLMSLEQRNQVTDIFSGRHRYLQSTAIWSQNKETFIKIFEDIATKHPNSTAVTFTNQSLTYNQLNRKAGELASFIQNEFPSAEENPIGICIAPSLELFVAIIAIAKIGSAFVPLDHEHPSSRLEDCISQSGIRILLSHTHTHNKTQGIVKNFLESDKSLDCINLDSLKTGLHSLTSNEVPLQSPAYIIFTSGSTGRPKGVLISQGALGQFCRMQSEYTRTDAQSKVLQMASIAFDAAIYEMVMAFTAGSELVVAPRELLKMPAQLNDFVLQHKITHSSVPPAMLPILDPQKWSSVKVIFLGGEKCPLDQLHYWSKYRKLYHAYGPTESTVFVTLALCDEHMQSSNIGIPVKTSYCYVLDKDLQPTPINVVGELYIGGDTLSSGYVNNLQLTSASFIPDPFARDASHILYRTGDLVRWLPDGNLDFIGRRDTQIKLRGYRIELDEIRSLLLNHEQVTDAVVITDKAEPDKKRILAYLVSKEQVTKANILEYLGGLLPQYMLPSEVIVLPEFPLTPNKKVNIAELPSPDTSISTSESYEPKNTTQLVIHNLWKEELNLTDIGIQQNFFSIGGNSLTISRIATKINKALNASIPLVVFVENQTINDLAVAIEKHLIADEDPFGSITSAHTFTKNNNEVEVIEL